MFVASTGRRGRVTNNNIFMSCNGISRRLSRVGVGAVLGGVTNDGFGNSLICRLRSTDRGAI